MRWFVIIVMLFLGAMLVRETVKVRPTGDGDRIPYCPPDPKECG